MMRFFFVLSTVYIATYAVYLGGSFVFRIRRNYKKDKLWLGILVVAMAYFGACINPPSHGWDLYRHYQYVHLVRFSGYSFSDYMFNPRNLLGGDTRSGLYGYKLLVYITAISGNDRILPFITLLIVYGIWAYLTMDWLLRKKRLDLLAPAFMMCLSAMPYVYVNTGIRNALAASIAAFALYREYVKEKSFIPTLILLAFSSTIHFVILLTIPCWILSHFKVKLRTVIAVAIGLMLLQPIAQLVYNKNIPGISQAANLFLIYSREGAYFFSYGYLIVDIVYLIGILGVFFKKREDQIMKLRRFVLVYGIIIFSQIGHYDLVLRPMYVMAMFSGYITYKVSTEASTRLGKQAFSLSLVIGLMVAFYLHGPSYILMSYC